MNYEGKTDRKITTELGFV